MSACAEPGRSTSVIERLPEGIAAVLTVGSGFCFQSPKRSFSIANNCFCGGSAPTIVSTALLGTSHVSRNANR